VRVVAGYDVGVRGVLGDDLFAGPASGESFRVGCARVAEAVWECSWRRTVPHDGSGAGSHDSIQGDIEFELEVDPISKSVT
jgi:hypothetical protein